MEKVDHPLQKLWQPLLLLLNSFQLLVGSFFAYFGSFFIVAFGQPAWIGGLAPVAACLGYLLFWVSISEVSPKKRFVLAAVWFMGAQLIQLSWMTSIEFQGYYILLVYSLLSMGLGLQFGLFTLCVPFTSSLSVLRVLALASIWTLIEWSRLFFLCGFSWNPVGLSLTQNLMSLQFVSIWGVFGLSFWVILVNLMGLKAWLSFSWKKVASWLLLALIPYGVGFYVLHVHSFTEQKEASFSVALVQTGLIPSEKVPLPGRTEEFVSPYDQWKNIIVSLVEKKQSHWDLIALPEAVVPIQATSTLYVYTDAIRVLTTLLGDEVLQKLPPLQAPFAEERILQQKSILCVSNVFWAQTLANFYQAEVVIGLDHFDKEDGCNYNSAFYFAPNQNEIKRYDKRVLLPLAEYLPFESVRALTRSYGIQDFFSHGKESLVWGKRIPLSVSICYEETFPNLIREGRLKGARLFVNLTNDNYYPNSRLPQQHFDHARLRAVENGVPLVRACNTGRTVVVDSFGRVLAQLGDSSKESERIQGALDFSFPIQTHRTLYTIWGDAGILSLSLFFLIVFFCFRRRFT